MSIEAILAIVGVALIVMGGLLFAGMLWLAYLHDLAKRYGGFGDED